MALHRHRPHEAPSSTSTHDGVGVRTYHRRCPASAIEISQRFISLAACSEPTSCLSVSVVVHISPLKGLKPQLAGMYVPDHEFAALSHSWISLHLRSAQSHWLKLLLPFPP